MKQPHEDFEEGISLLRQAAAPTVYPGATTKLRAATDAAAELVRAFGQPRNLGPKVEALRVALKEAGYEF